MEIYRRLNVVLIAIFLVILGGSTGYYFLFGGEPKFMDCVYMTVISLTTVGYGEVIDVSSSVPAQIFTMVLIVFGMGVLAYGISAMTAVIVEGELSGILRKKRMQKEISKMKNHYIICGGGRTGLPVIEELVKNSEAVVLVEANQDRIEVCQVVADLPFIKGDATTDENLIAAGIEHASGIIITLPEDKDNLYVTMTARMMNSQIRIISRMTNPAIAAKLQKAGADGVVSPNNIGALRMASEMIRPTVVDFLDSMLRTKQGNLRINQLSIPSGSSWIGTPISRSGLETDYHLLILAARADDDQLVFNPPSDLELTADMTLIVMGESEDIKRARQAV